MQSLKINSTLQGGKYKIIATLGQGGFGITYLAENTMLDGKVAIKEFFFKDYCNRDEETSHVTIPTEGNREIVERFKTKFIKEARTIFKLNHPNIVRILDIFEENGTAYYVMDYIEGESLNDLVKRRGAIPEAEAIGYIREAGSALTYIHGKNLNHLDIKPGNLMKRKDNGKVQVIDFGVSKQYDSTTGNQTSTTPVGISHGYAPIEQYQKNGVQSFSPQSDVYALAATLFKLLTGITPPEAMIVQDEGLPVEDLRARGVSQRVINAIDAAMQTRRKRTQSVAEFLRNLESKDEGEATVITANIPKTEGESSSKNMNLSNNSNSSVNSDCERILQELANNMIYVQGGRFTMGFARKRGWLSAIFEENNDNPAHSVTLSSFYICKYEVTQELWQAVMGSNPSRIKGIRKPVEQVSWDDCQTFISKLNALTGKNYRLPTEAEWEFAARGGIKSKGYKYSGSNIISDVAWYEDNSGGTTHDVGTKNPNELGLYDMSGNVWEWCSDWYDSNYYSRSISNNPIGPSSGTYRVDRGGSWSSIGGCYSSNRDYFTPSSRNTHLGLRLCLSE